MLVSYGAAHETCLVMVTLRHSIYRSLLCARPLLRAALCRHSPSSPVLLSVQSSSVPDTAGNQLVPRALMTLMTASHLAKVQESHTGSLIGPLGSVDRVSRALLLLEHFLLWLPSCFILLISLPPQTASSVTCVYQVTRRRTQRRAVSPSLFTFPPRALCSAPMSLNSIGTMMTCNFIIMPDCFQELQLHGHNCSLDISA